MGRTIFLSHSFFQLNSEKCYFLPYFSSSLFSTQPNMAISRASAEMQGGLLYPTSEVSALVGREDAERELVSQLLDGTEENLSVISLVREEAVGKTALVKACL